MDRHSRPDRSDYRGSSHNSGSGDHHHRSHHRSDHYSTTTTSDRRPSSSTSSSAHRSRRDRSRSSRDRDSTGRRDRSRDRSRDRESSRDRRPHRSSHRSAPRSRSREPSSRHSRRHESPAAAGYSSSRRSRSPSPTSMNPEAPPPPSFTAADHQRFYSHHSVPEKAEEPAYEPEPLDDARKELIHRQMQERLAAHLAREGKVYPPPKPQAQHPIFANDGSFLEHFKRMQEGGGGGGGGEGSAQQSQQLQHSTANAAPSASSSRPAPQLPVFGKRRGGKILKTGIVAKPKQPDADAAAADGKTDAWSLYLAEVQKYKSVSCESESKTRPLVK